MTVYAETLGWAVFNKRQMTLDPSEADNIVVLSCQVTDLAILNDLKILNNLKNKKVKTPKYSELRGGTLNQDLPIFKGMDLQPEKTNGGSFEFNPQPFRHFKKENNEETNLYFKCCIDDVWLCEK